MQSLAAACGSAIATMTTYIESALHQMASLVDRGDFKQVTMVTTLEVGMPHRVQRYKFCGTQAAHVGNQADVPLGLDARDLLTKSEISRGTQSIVYEGAYDDRRVAIKKARISKSADLDSFKLEVVVMANLRHVSSVVSLVAARLIPPGAGLAACVQLICESTSFGILCPVTRPVINTHLAM